MRFGFQILHRAAIIVLMLVVAFGMTLFFALQSSMPYRDGIAIVSNLSDKVDIRRDAQGMPSIESSQRENVLFGLGFVHAQDQFLTMDLLRRSSVGTLHELLGAKALSADIQRRHYGLETLVEELWQQASDQHRALLWAYSHGVNAGLNQLNQPPTFYSLRQQQPQAWEPQDALRVLLSLVVLSHEPQLGNALGMDELEAPMIVRSLSFSETNQAYQLSIQSTNPLPLDTPWYPARWRIVGQSGWAQGLTLPGLPSLLMGRHQNMAWSLHRSEHAPFQWLSLQVTEEQFWHPEWGWRDFTYHTIHRPGRGEAHLVRHTPWGPVMGADGDGQWLVLSWPNLKAHELSLNWLDLDQHTQTTELLAHIQSLPGTELMAIDRNGSWSMQQILSSAEHVIAVNETLDPAVLQPRQPAVWRSQQLLQPLHIETPGNTSRQPSATEPDTADPGWLDLLVNSPANSALWQPRILFSQQETPIYSSAFMLQFVLSDGSPDHMTGLRIQSRHPLQPYESFSTEGRSLSPGPTRHQLTLLPGR